jgi:multiple sugar transport system substrate-binding protein
MKLLSFLRSFSRIALVLVVISVLALGCSRKTGVESDAPVTLTIWKPFADEQTMRVLFDEYTKLHPNVSFQYSQRNIETYEDDLLNSLAAGEGPDIFSINNTWLPKYLDKITPATAEEFPFKEYHDAFIDVVINDFSRDQQVYGTALSVDSLALYYNKDILGTVGIVAPPKTWDELERDVRKIVRQDQTGYFTRSGVAMGTSQNVNRAQDILALLMLQSGTTPWSADGLSPTFANSQGAEGLRFYTSFADPINANYNWNQRSDYSIDAFANGRAAFLYSYTYARDQILAKAPNLNFDVAPVPQPNLDNTSVNFANYFGEVVNKQSENANWAWNFLRFASSQEALDKYYAQTKLPSSRKDLIALQIQDLDIGVFAHANLTAKSFYKPDEAKMNVIMNKMIDNVLLNGMSVSNALSQAQNEASTLPRR